MVDYSGKRESTDMVAVKEMKNFLLSFKSFDNPFARHLRYKSQV